MDASKIIATFVSVQLTISLIVYLLTAFLLFAFGCNDQTTDQSEISQDNITQCFDIKIVGECQKNIKLLKGVVTDGSIIRIRIIKLGQYKLSNIKLSVSDKSLGGVSLTP